MAPLFHMTVCVPREEVDAAMPWGFVGNVVTGGEFAHLSSRLWVFPFPSRSLHFRNDLKPPQADYASLFLVLRTVFPQRFKADSLASQEADLFRSAGERERDWLLTTF